VQALATPKVAILTGQGAVTFSRQASAGGKATFVGVHESYADLERSRPGTIFEAGSRWAMVPAKLYRYEDRAQYLAEQYPHLPESRIGVIAVPELGAMGLFDRDTAVPEALYSGNHVAELYISLATSLANRRDALAQLFFQEGVFWLTLVRNGRVVVFKSFRFAEPADVIFHLAAMLEQYGLDRQHAPILIGGAVAAESQLENQLRIYFDCRRLTTLDDVPLDEPAVQLMSAYDAALMQRPAPLRA